MTIYKAFYTYNEVQIGRPLPSASLEIMKNIPLDAARFSHPILSHVSVNYLTREYFMRYVLSLKLELMQIRTSNLLAMG